MDSTSTRRNVGPRARSDAGVAVGIGASPSAVPEATSVGTGRSAVRSDLLRACPAGRPRCAVLLPRPGTRQRLMPAPSHAVSQAAKRHDACCMAAGAARWLLQSAPARMVADAASHPGRSDQQSGQGLPATVPPTRLRSLRPLPRGPVSRETKMDRDGMSAAPVESWAFGHEHLC